MNLSQNVRTALRRLSGLLLAAVLASSPASAGPAPAANSSPARSFAGQPADSPWRMPVQAEELRPFAVPPSPWGAGL
ncbi:hypothetical protein [Nesterenkonia sp. Act20]|uniref:hypothetical protein n=1 Tax=Nesterenkonia sp. Act20 TaxID=1483432 RepID=UPI001C439B70|nr:hypothetical protein [Nesterenkonia sp. Act20]